MNQRVNNETDLTENEKKLYKKLEAARSEYQKLNYEGQLILVEPKKNRPWIPVSIAASIIAISVLVISVQTNNSNFSKVKLTLSKIDVPVSFPSGLNRSPIISNKNVSLFAHRPITPKKFKSKFKMRIRPSKQTG